MIPKSLNFIWVGNPDLQPDACIRTWIDKHPGWNVRIWGNANLAERTWVTDRHIQTMVRERQWCGVADLMRWELLLEFGGVFLDADSVCVRPLPEVFLEGEAFACWENELDRPGLIATGYLGARPGNPLVAKIVQELKETPSISGQEAWKCTGPKRLSDAWRKYGYDQLTILPSHYFLPRHYSGRVYHGGGSIYADQFWASTKQGYEKLARGLDGWSPTAQTPLPRITIGMPARNASRWLREALKSALDQDYPDFEVLVVDDESSDDTPVILASMQDPRLRILRKIHTNLPDVRNVILREASGQYICWLDSDDVLLPHTLAAYGERARDWPETAVFYGNLLKIDAEGRETGRFNYDNHAGSRNLLARLFVANHMPNPGTLVRVSSMREAGGFDEATAGSCDYDLWLRLVARGQSLQHIGRDVVRYRWHGDNLSFNADHIRASDLYILNKLVSTMPLEELCSDLPWHDPVRARKEALTRVGNLFLARGDANQASLWLDGSTAGRPAADEDETDRIQAKDPLPTLPTTENPGSPFLFAEASPGMPAPHAVHQEDTLFEPDGAFPSFAELTETLYGLMLYPPKDQYVGHSLKEYGEFNQGVLDLLAQFIGAGAVTLDVGANIGAHTVPLAQWVGSTGVVVAFEPQPVLYKILCANLVLNNIPNVLTYATALGNSEGECLIPVLDYSQPNNFGGVGMDTVEDGEAVPLCQLDGFQLERVDFIKLDVEGYEAKVLEGATNTIERCHPIMYIKNDRADKSAELIQRCFDLGYRLWWHTPPLFSPDNFKGNAENAFPGIVSINMLAIHRNMRPIEGLKPILTAEDTWR